MNPRVFLNLFSASDADERRARALVATLGLLAAIAFIAVIIAGDPARTDRQPMPSGAVGAVTQGMSTNALFPPSSPVRADAHAHPVGTINQ